MRSDLWPVKFSLTPSRTACQVSGLGRTTIYEAIGTGKLEARKAGNRTLIVADSLLFISCEPARRQHPHRPQGRCLISTTDLQPR